MREILTCIDPCCQSSLSEDQGVYIILTSLSDRGEAEFMAYTIYHYVIKLSILLSSDWDWEWEWNGPPVQGDDIIILGPPYPPTTHPRRLALVCSLGWTL